jgi:hypothetical protein
MRLPDRKRWGLTVFTSYDNRQGIRGALQVELDIPDALVNNAGR